MFGTFFIKEKQEIAFIIALTRSIAQSGNVRIMKSNKDSNFVGAERELGEALKEMDFQVKSFLEKDKTGWIVRE